MKKKLVIVILLVAVTASVALLLWAWLDKPSPPSGQTVFEPAEETTVVRFNGTTFSPELIKEKAGARVYFVNESNSERPMYVASDDHPTHTLYPGFDAANTGNGFPGPRENFEFTFEKTGRWSYHDHNYPAAQAAIIVE